MTMNKKLNELNINSDMMNMIIDDRLPENNTESSMIVFDMYESLLDEDDGIYHNERDYQKNIFHKGFKTYIEYLKKHDYKLNEKSEFEDYIFFINNDYSVSRKLTHIAHEMNLINANDKIVTISDADNSMSLFDDEYNIYNHDTCKHEKLNINNVKLINDEYKSHINKFQNDIKTITNTFIVHSDNSYALIDDVFYYLLLVIAGENDD